MNKKIALLIAGIFGFTGVLLGAFGAHVLSEKISIKMLEIYKTGILYHLIHSAILVALALNYDFKLRYSFIFISIGIIFFSFSLYLYTLTQIKFFAIITPAGGISFLIGWFLLILKGISKKTL